MAKKIGFLGIMTALAMVLGFLEQLIPLPAPVPGIKLGLANAASLIVLYKTGYKEALLVSAARILLGGGLFTGATGMLYGLAGGLLSFCAMCLGKKTQAFSIIGVSALGGVFHNIGQISLAVLVTASPSLFYYLPVLAMSGVITGVLTGFIAGRVLVYIERF